MAEDEARNHQSVDWAEYYYKIRQQCPWSWNAYRQGLIDVQPWQGQVQPLGLFQARVYICEETDSALELLAQSLDHGEDEWLFSYPGYGEFATPVSVLIQQNRRTLAEIRSKT